MPTLLSSIRSQARLHLKETTAKFWTDAELLDITIKGVNDLWGAVIDLAGEHFQTIDATNVSLAADGTTLTGVPADTFRVHLIEPRDTTSSGAHRSVLFVPRDYNSAEFIAARARSSTYPTSGLTIYYALRSQGAPVAAPTVEVAPKVNSAVNLRFVYIPTLATLTAASDNPIPGESDHALIAWTVAFARPKEREDRSPDPNWLTIYATEKQALLTRLTPRQTQEPEVVEGVFDYLW